MNYKDLFIGLLGGLVVVLGILLFQSQGLSLGAQSNFSGPLNSLAGYQESGTTIVSTDREATFVGLRNSSGTTIGSGTTLTGATCGTASFNPPNLIGGASSSVDVTVTGATIAQNQVYFAGVNTSTFDLVLNANASGTGGTINVALINAATGTFPAYNLGTSTFSACYIQF